MSLILFRFDQLLLLLLCLAFTKLTLGELNAGNDLSVRPCIGQIKYIDRHEKEN